VLVEAGPFRMGATPDEAEAAKALARRFRVDPPAADLALETPARPVDLPAFYLDRFEVTNERYERFVRETGRAAPASAVGKEYDVWHDGSYPADLARHPVVNVSWDDASAYCAWAGARLPTEAEWEKAARGAGGWSFPWGSHWDAGRANHGRAEPGARRWKGDAQDGFLNTAPVGSFPAGRSPYGADDMAGNALEWVEDRFDAAPRTGSAGGAAPPREERVLRGGSWYYDPVRLRTTFRHHLPADFANGHTGFRCAQPAAP
jgi:serine/threonine-protein kinase